MVNTRSKTTKTQKEEDPDQQKPGEIVGSNDDLLTEILLRLPAASIICFRSVSKHWRSLLRQRHFIQRFDKLSKSPGVYTWGTFLPFDVESPIPPGFITLDFHPDPLFIRMMQSCNGLMLCSSHRGPRGYSTYYVFNPTTKQFAIIPSVPGGFRVLNSLCLMGLAFHQTDRVHFKLVFIHRLEPGPNVFQIQVYSSDTREWKICMTFDTNWPSSCNGPQSEGGWHGAIHWLHFFKGVYWNGAVHWAPCFHNHMYFDIEAEQLHTLPLPAVMTSSKTSTMYFGESRGHLHMMVGINEGDTAMDVYEMLSDRSGWFVKYRVELHELWGACPEMNRSPYDFNVVDVVRGEKEEDAFIVVIFPGKLIRYNLHDKSFKLMCNVTSYDLRKYSSYDRYIESLASF